ncbi:phage head closure protein [Methylocystis sp. JR02]|uniref:phage head closure protein n=1 Tax=Methylocystis sp. JR02 TaxID=3046284 RepID=UPI0024B924A6|nr:phage head closure protein [Methylocystis sp. JR02]MDJ0449049.1 phage head closure protein [Methylocystis sp. JR02]
MSARPMIGAMRQRVTLEAPTDARDDVGGIIRIYAPLVRLWAQIETQGAEEQFIEQRLEQSRKVTVTIRWRADVQSQMRFDFRGRKLIIESVADINEKRRFLRCLCEEFS